MISVSLFEKPVPDDADFIDSSRRKSCDKGYYHRILFLAPFSVPTLVEPHDQERGGDREAPGTTPAGRSGGPPGACGSPLTAPTTSSLLATDPTSLITYTLDPFCADGI